MGTRINIATHKHDMKLDKINKRCKKGNEAIKYTMRCQVEGCKAKTVETMNCTCGDWRG